MTRSDLNRRRKVLKNSSRFAGSLGRSQEKVKAPGRVWPLDLPWAYVTEDNPRFNDEYERERGMTLLAKGLFERTWWYEKITNCRRSVG